MQVEGRRTCVVRAGAAGAIWLPEDGSAPASELLAPQQWDEGVLASLSGRGRFVTTGTPGTGKHRQSIHSGSKLIDFTI